MIYRLEMIFSFAGIENYEASQAREEQHLRNTGVISCSIFFLNSQKIRFAEKSYHNTA